MDLQLTGGLGTKLAASSSVSIFFSFLWAISLACRRPRSLAMQQTQDYASSLRGDRQKTMLELNGRRSHHSLGRPPSNMAGSVSRVRVSIKRDAGRESRHGVACFCAIDRPTSGRSLLAAPSPNGTRLAAGPFSYLDTTEQDWSQCRSSLQPIKQLRAGFARPAAD
jgi:hypothetical protein